jgi:hypothetical protein
MNLTKKNIEIINEIIGLYIRYVNANLGKDLKEVNKQISKRKLLKDMTYDQLTENIVEISGDEYFEELKIERLE